MLTFGNSREFTSETILHTYNGIQKHKTQSLGDGWAADDGIAYLILQFTGNTNKLKINLIWTAKTVPKWRLFFSRMDTSKEGLVSDSFCRLCSISLEPSLLIKTINRQRKMAKFFSGGSHLDKFFFFEFRTWISWRRVRTFQKLFATYDE